MEGKKIFTLYTDLIKIVNGSDEHGVIVEPMSNEEAGMLFRWMLEYVNDMHPSVPKEIKYPVAFVKKQLDDDLEKYKDKCKKNKDNINKRWNDEKNENIRTNTNEYERIPNDTKDTDKDKDKDKDKDINKDKLDKLDKLGNAENPSLYSKIENIKQHLEDNGLDLAFYKRLDFDIAPYYYTKKLDQINCKAIDSYYKIIKGDEVQKKVFFYTLNKILESDFKPDNFIGYFNSVFDKNYERYIKQLEKEQ